MSYNELLAPFGLDARDPAFWSIGLEMIEGLIAELEAMEEQARFAAKATRRPASSP